MRILVKLNPQVDSPYDNDYHYHLQAFVYTLVRESGRAEVHDKLGYKFFCFSNLFPYRARFQKGGEVKLLISTPDPVVAADLSRLLREMIGKKRLWIGKLEFSIVSVDGPLRLKADLGGVVKLRSSTPIIIRIPSERYTDYGITSERPYVFWRETIPLDAFVKQLQDNMEKKILKYGSPDSPLGYRSSPGSEKTGPIPLAEILSYRYLKTVSKPITVKGETHQIIGSIWEFEFSPQSKAEASNLEFAAECGFGERNSLGFGFVNAL